MLSYRVQMYCYRKFGRLPQVPRCAQVWVDDIAYVRLKRRFAYVHGCFTRMIRGWQFSQHPTPIFDIETAPISITPRCLGDPL